MSVSRLRQSGHRAVPISGGAGFIGTNLAHRLLRDRRPVRMYERATGKQPNTSVERGVQQLHPWSSANRIPALAKRAVGI